MTELHELPAPEDQQRTKVYRHPDRDTIHSLLRGGKSPEWISKWLAARYPTEDEHGDETDDAARNARWQLSEASLKRYRHRFMPECAPGVDVIVPELADALGRRPPVPRELGARYELEVLESVIEAGQASLARALRSDKDMDMLQGVTLDAQKTVIEAARTRVELAQSLGIDGYAKVAAKQEIKQSVESRNVNVEVNGIVDAHGVVHPSEPKKVAVLAELMAMDAERAKEVLATAGPAVEAEAEAEEAEVVDEPES